MPSVQNLLGKLRALDASGTSGFEGLVRDALAEITGSFFRIAASGRQGGVDLLGRGNVFTIGLEAKRYGEDGSLPVAQLKLKIADASQTYPDLDLWVLATTREIKLLDARELDDFGATYGIAVLVLDTRETTGGVPRLATLLAAAPQTAARWFADDPGVLGDLQVITAAPEHPRELANIRSELTKADIGWDNARRTMAHWIREALERRDLARSRLHSFAELLEANTRLVDRGEVAAISPLVENPGQLFAVIGLEGYGKTWFVLKWWLERSGPDGSGLPLTIFLAGQDVGPGSLEANIANALHERTNLRTAVFWSKRVRRWSEGGVASLLVILDGLNQTNGPVSWADLIRPALTDHWAGRICIVLTVRPDDWDQIHRLQSIHPKPVELKVQPYTDQQLDTLLGRHGLKRKVFDPRLFEFLRVPRLFALAARRQSRMLSYSDLTPEALALEEYRERLAFRGEPLSLGEEGFRELIARLGTRFQEAMRTGGAEEITRRHLVDEIQADTGEARNLRAMLSELTSGIWLQKVGENRFKLEPTAVPFALGLALVAKSREEARDPDSWMPEFLDVFRGSSLGVAILRSACAVALLGERVEERVLDHLLQEWIGAQNFDNTDFHTLWRLTAVNPGPLLRFAEMAWLRHHHGRSFDEILSKVIGYAGAQGVDARPVVIETVRGWLGRWWPDHLQGRILGRNEDHPGQEEREALVRARAKRWTEEVVPLLGSPPKLLEEGNGYGWAWVARRAAYILSYLPAETFMEPLRSWAAAGAIFGWTSYTEVIEWAARWDDAKDSSLEAALIAAAQEFAATDHELGLHAAASLLWAYSSPTARSIIDADPRLQAKALSLDPEPGVESVHGLIRRDEKWPEGADLDLVVAAEVGAAWTAATAAATARSEQPEDLPEILGRVARWAPERTSDVISGWLSAASDLSTPVLVRLAGTALKLPLLVSDEQRSMLAQVLRDRFRGEDIDPDDTPIVTALEISDLTGEAQVDKLVSRRFSEVPTLVVSVLKPLPLGRVEELLKAASDAGNRDNLILWLSYALEAGLDGSPSPESIIARLSSNPDDVVRRLAIAFLWKWKTLELALAFAGGTWLWTPNMDGQEAAHGSLLLLASDGSPTSIVLSRADPRVYGYAYRENRDFGASLWRPSKSGCRKRSLAVTAGRRRRCGRRMTTTSLGSPRLSPTGRRTGSTECLPTNACLTAFRTRRCAGCSRG